MSNSSPVPQSALDWGIRPELLSLLLTSNTLHSRGSDPLQWTPLESEDKLIRTQSVFEPACPPWHPRASLPPLGRPAAARQQARTG